MGRASNFHMGCIAAALSFAVLSLGQTAPPTFTLDHVIPSGRARPTWLAPGMFISIYGSNLGPPGGCVAKANYPTELCGVQVFVGDLAAGLLYVQNDQINFQVPRDSAMEGMAELKVVYQGQTNSRILVPLGVEPVALSVDGVARVGGPVWIKIDMPTWGEVRYPARFPPLDFGCNQMEVRQNGVLLPRIPVRPPGAMMINGPLCGMIQIPGPPPQHTGRLPLHLQYRFEKPGVYEVRYTLKPDLFGSRADQVVQQSAWTRFEVLPAQARPRQTAPLDPAEILSDYLPSVLGFSDAAGLKITLRYLYHPEEIVRRYAESALLYWPQEEVDREAAALVRTKGPTDVLMNVIGTRGPDLVDAILPYLMSDDPVLLRGAIVGVSRSISDPQKGLEPNVRARAEDRLIAATEHILQKGDERTLMEFSVALGSVRDDRAREVLWNMVERGIASGQSLIAISWHKDVRDLPRLGAMLTLGPEDVDRSREFASIPYAIRNSYGDAAVPYLEAGLKESLDNRVRASCAQELIIAGRASGFAFAVDAIQGNRPYKREMVQFVRDRFQLKNADESSVLEFVKQRAI